MSLNQTPPPPNASSHAVNLRKGNFLVTLKTIFWSFLAGFATCAGGAGYLVINAEKYNIPVSIKGNNNTQTTNKIDGNQLGGDNSGNVGTNNGNQAGANNSGVVGNGTGLGDISAGPGAKIDIRITPGDPKFENEQLPGYFPDKGFTETPPQLTQFDGATVFTRDLIVSGEASFRNENVVIRGRNYVPVFYLQGSNKEAQRVAFKLNGTQKGALLQFGVTDLASGDTNLTYQVNISADGRKIWSGRVIYGTNQQILSIPLEIPGVNTLVIEHIISQGGDYPTRLSLVFTRAELLYK